MNKTIAVDVDGVVIDIGPHWLKYLSSSYWRKDDSYNIRIGESLPYNLTELFNVRNSSWNNGFEWWDNFELYDILAPRIDAVQYLPAIRKLGYEIVFVSKVIGNHGASKERFIKRWFPDHHAIVFTESKQYCKCDMLIDDSFKNLNSMPKEVECLKFRMDYKEKELPTRDYTLVSGWEEINNILLKREAK
jgi:5'(3')-deoxyribonucleotidase